MAPALAAMTARSVGVVAVIAPLALLLIAVERFGVNVVVADEMHYVDFIRAVREGGDWPSWLWQQHNEHRVVPMKLLMALLAGPTRWSQHAEMVCSAALTGLLVFALWRIFRDMRGRDDERHALLVFAPLAWLACSLSQYENQLYGMMVCHYFTVAGGVAAIWLLGRPGRLSTWLAVLAATISATSVASGLLVFPAGIVLLAARRSAGSRWLPWTASGVLVFALHFRNYVRPPHVQAFPWELASIPRVASLGVGTIGSPLAAGSLAWSVALGTAMSALALVLLVRWLHAEPSERARQAPAATVLAWGLASCAMIALGRAFLVNPGWTPLISRYVTHTNLVWFGVYLLLLSGADSGGWARLKSAFSSVLLVGLLAANLQGIRAARAWRHDRLLDQYVLQTSTLQPDSALGRLGSPAAVRAKAAYLEQERLSAFAEPQSLLMLLDATAGVPTAEVRRGQALEQRLICPVDELRDVGVDVFPAERPAGGSFSIIVRSEDRELARRALAVADIRGRTWVRLQLPRAFRCSGRELEIRIESEVEAGEGIKGFAAQPFYAGRLAQGGMAVPGSELGLALNAYRFGIVRGGL